MTDDKRPKLRSVVSKIHHDVDTVQSVFDEALKDIGEIESVLITGITKDGQDFMYSSPLSGMEMLWLSERIRQQAMKEDDE